MPLAVKINVALREQNCQKFGSKRVKLIHFVTPMVYELTMCKQKYEKGLEKKV